MFKSNSAAGVLCGISGAVLFGFSFLFTKQGMDAASPLTLLGWRFIFGLLFMTLCLPLKILKVDYKNKPVGKVILLGALQPVLYFVGEIFGIELTTTGEASTIIAMIPIFVMILSSAVLKEPPSPLQAAGIVISLAGIFTIIVSKGITASLSIPGYLLLFTAVAADSFYVILSRKLAVFTVPEKVYVMTAAGALVFGAAALFEHGSAGTLREFFRLPLQNIDFLITVLYLSLGCTVLAFLLSIHSIALIGATRSTSFVPLTTIVSVLAGVVILDERISFLQGTGIVLTLAGVFLANKTQKLIGSERSV